MSRLTQSAFCILIVAVLIQPVAVPGRGVVVCMKGALDFLCVLQWVGGDHCLYVPAMLCCMIPPGGSCLGMLRLVL